MAGELVYAAGLPIVAGIAVVIYRALNRDGRS